MRIPTDREKQIHNLELAISLTGHALKFLIDQDAEPPTLPPVGEPPNEIVLPIDHASQSGPGAKKYPNDCGPACVKMIGEAYYPDGALSIDEIFEQTGRTGNDFTNTWDLQRVLYESYQIAANREIGPDLKEAIALGLGIIALVNYAKMQDWKKSKSNFRGMHFVVVAGCKYDEFGALWYWVLDPLRDEGIWMPKKVFEAAWSTAELVRGAIITANEIGADVGEIVRYQVVNRHGLYIRQGPSVDTKAIGSLAIGQVRQVFEVVTWPGGRFGRIGADRWIALVIDGKVYASEVE